MIPLTRVGRTSKANRGQIVHRKRQTPVMALQTRKHLALRIPENDLDRIDQLAASRRLTRTEYIIQASTGQLEPTLSGIPERLRDIEAKVARLEEFAF